MPRPVDMASRRGASSEDGRSDGTWPARDMPAGRFERILASLLLGPSQTSGRDNHIRLPQGSSHERIPLDADRTLAVFRMQAGAVYAAMGNLEEPPILAWAAGRDLEVKPLGDLLDAAILNLGDILVYALDSGSRCFRFNFEHVRAVGDEALGIFKSLCGQLSREGLDWELVFVNVAEDFRPLLKQFDTPRTGADSGE